MNNYVVTAHKASRVTLTAVGNFLSPMERDLLVARNKKIDVYTFGVEGLIHAMEIPIYGRLDVMELCKPPGDKQDMLMILTERYQFCVLKWNADLGECETLAAADVKDKLSRPSEHASNGIVDPQFRCFGLSLYERLVKIIPTDWSKEAFNICVGKDLQDVVFLHGCAVPTMAILDVEKHRGSINAIEIPQDANAIESSREAWTENIKVDRTSSLVAVPEPMCGVLVVSRDRITYVPSKQPGEGKFIPIPPTTEKQIVGRVDEDGSRYLLGDCDGNLRLLVLERENDQVTGLKVEKLGVTSIASTISYLDNGFVFIGSRYGDSQLIQLTTEMDQFTFMNLKVMATFPNIGPIVDFCVADLERYGQKLVVTCSGSAKDGSLRVIRNGISVNEQASVELPGVKDMFSLKKDPESPSHRFLVQSFSTETRVLEMVSSEEMQEAIIPGFDQQAPTLFAGNMAGSTIVQVSAGGIRLLSCDTMSVLSTWAPPDGFRISVATGNSEQVLVAMSGGNLISLVIDTKKKQLVETARSKLENEISCLNCNPFGQASRGQFAVVGTWNDVTVRLLLLPSLEVLHAETLGGETIARSVLLVTLDGMDMLMVAAGDGHLFFYKFNRAGKGQNMLQDKRILNIGTQPATLAPIRNAKSSYVFAACDRPTVIHVASGSKKILLSNVNLREVTRVVPFDSESFPDCLAIATEDALIVGSVDDVQRLHVRSIPLNCSPRRIARVASANAFAVLCSQSPSTESKSGGGGKQKDGSQSATSYNFLRLFDEDFVPTHSYRLRNNEIAISLTTTTFNEDSEKDAKEYIVVGTADGEEDSAERPQSNPPGRLLVFMVNDAGLVLMAEKILKVCAYAVKPFMGGIVAGSGGRIILFKWEQNSDVYGLVPKCSHVGQALALDLDCRDRMILSGDIFRSMSLLKFEGDNTLQDVARDYDPNWMTAVAILDEKHFLGSDDSFNFFTLKWKSDAPEDEERGHLQRVGQFHLGEYVNAIRPGSLVMQPMDADGPVLGSYLFGCVEGTLGIVAQLKKDAWQFFHRVEVAMAKTIKGIGGLKHSDWRSFSNASQTSDARQFIDGDLVEKFLDLPLETMEKVARLADVSVEELTKRVEEISRLH